MHYGPNTCKPPSRGHPAAQAIPMTIAQTALCDPSMTRAARATAAASRRSFCAMIDATRAAITEIESASRNAATFGEASTRLITNAPAMRLARVIPAIMMIVITAVRSSGTEKHSRHSPDEGGHDNVPAYRQQVQQCDRCDTRGNDRRKCADGLHLPDNDCSEEAGHHDINSESSRVADHPAAKSANRCAGNPGRPENEAATHQNARVLLAVMERSLAVCEIRVAQTGKRQDTSATGKLIDPRRERRTHDEVPGVQGKHNQCQRTEGQWALPEIKGRELCCPRECQDAHRDRLKACQSSLRRCDAESDTEWERQRGYRK